MTAPWSKQEETGSGTRFNKRGESVLSCRRGPATEPDRTNVNAEKRETGHHVVERLALEQPHSGLGAEGGGSPVNRPGFPGG